MTQLAPYVTATFVGRLYGVSPETVRRWARDGLVPAVTLPSGQVRFRREDVENLASAVVPKTAPAA
jgi:excisionase family DNA binding protein